MNIKLKKENLIYIFIYINVFCKGIGLESNSNIYLSLLSLGIVALALKLISDKYTHKEFINLVSIFIIGTINFIVTKKPTLLLTCLCLIGLKNINIEKLFKGMLNIRLITFISMIFLSLIGFISNNTIQMWRMTGFVNRYSLGFEHPNSLHLALFILLSLYIYVRYDNLKLKDYLFLIIINLIIGFYSKSLTGLIVTTILIVITFISKLNKKHINKLIINSPKYIFIFLLLFSFITALLYGKYPIIDALNTILNGRIAYSHYYLSNYNLTLFGSNIILDKNALFDNGYLYLYTQFGIIGLIFISYILLKIFKNAKKENNIRQSILLITYLIYIFTESFSPNIFMNIILFFAADIIFKKGDIENES